MLGFCVGYLFCGVILDVNSSLAIISLRMRELIQAPGLECVTEKNVILNQNIFCGYSQEPFEHQRHVFRLMSKKTKAILS